MTKPCTFREGSLTCAKPYGHSGDCGKTADLPFIYEAIKQLLVERGWQIDPKGKESFSGPTKGATKEFIHPEKGYRATWIDAIVAEGSRESGSKFL